MSDLPKQVRIHEEGPREGFQIEPAPIPTHQKIELVDALSETGLQHIQTVSFVNPKRVPGWADADEVVQGFRPHPDVRYSALWLNPKGFERALAYRDRLTLRGAIRVGASEAFMTRNQGVDFARNAARESEQVELYKAHAVPVTGIGVMAAFGCNFQGEITVDRVLDAVSEALEIAGAHRVAPEQIRLADTMGWATPDRIKRTVAAVRDRFPQMEIHLHLHDTRGMAVANAYAALEMGVSSYDSAVAGLGGCPFAGNAGAAGNICTEDLVFLCEEMGIETGIDLDRLIEVAQLAERIFRRPLPGSVMHGGTLARFRKAA